MVFDLERELKSTGKTTFVYCFPILQRYFNVENRHVLGERTQYFLENTYGYSKGSSYHREVSFAQRIFKQGMEYEALAICANSPRVDEKVRDLANMLLNTKPTFIEDVVPEDTLMESDDYQHAVNTLDILVEADFGQLSPSPVKTMRESRTYKASRNIGVAKRALTLAHHQCMIERTHNTFIHHVSGKPYMEAHHLIPIQHQARFDCSLDVISNVVSLCPSCHRMVHYAESKTKKEALHFLLDERQALLKQQGLEVELNELIQCYG